jgi:hypothetical protein
VPTYSICEVEDDRLKPALRDGMMDHIIVPMAELYCGDAEPGSFNQERKIGFV